MAKAKSLYVCSACGAQSYKWQGKCTNCDSWNTLELQEEPARKSQDRGFSLRSSSPPTPISEVSSQQEERYQTGIAELDRVLGGGVVPGSLTLLAGEPGVGKSTLLLQMAKEFSEKWGKVLYISGEESLQQIKMRAKRIGAANNSIYLLSENNVDSMIRAIEDIDPAIVIVDSIQTLMFPSRNRHQELSPR